jgi:tetratricopeptide (TPR) repeat protein
MGAWEKTCDVLTGRASSASDPETARLLYARAATIAESRLGDDARAIDAHRRTLEQMPDDEAALEALDRLLAKQGAHEELAEILERRVQGESDPTLKNELLLRLGTLRWEQFEDTRGAFSAFQEVLERDPSEPRALGAMEGLLASNETLAAEAVEVLDNAYRATGATAKVAGLYDVRIKLADNDGERVRLYGELAALRENELGDREGALEAWVSAFGLDPRDATALDEAERLAGATGAWPRLRGLVENAIDGGKVDRDARRDLDLRAASWYRDRLGDVAAAEARLRSAVIADRESEAAHGQLVELLRSGGREEDLTSALSAWADVELDETAKKERLREAAALAEGALNDVDRAAGLLRKVLETDGADAPALDELVRIEGARGKHGEVAKLLERRIDVESDPDARVGLRRQLARVVSGPLMTSGAEATERAIDAWRAVLDEAPTDLDAMDQLERLYDGAKRYSDLEDLVQRRLDVADTPADRIAGRVRLARLVDRMGRRGEAIDQLNDILAEDPGNADALNELEDLLSKEKRWEELGELLDRRTERARSMGDRDTLRATLLKVATLREEQLEDESGARSALADALELGEDAATLERAAVLAEKGGDVDGGVTLRERRLAHLSGADAVDEANRIAELAESKLSDVPRAERALRHAWELDRSADAPKKKLVAFYEKHKRHAELAEVLRADAEAATDKGTKLALVRRVSDLYAKELGDPGSAAVLLEEASRIDPEDRNILLPLCDLYIAAGRQRDAVPVLQKIIASYGTKRTKEVAVYQHRLGQALEGMGDVPGALAAFDAAFKIDLTNVPILRDLGRLCWRTNDFDRAQKTFRALLLQKLDGNSGIGKGDIYFYLGDIAAKQGDPKKGIQNLERALVEQPGHPEAAALLKQLKG